MVFCCGAEERHTANIDLFNGLWEGTGRVGDGLLEWVEVADNNGDGRNVLGPEVLLIGRNVSS